VDERRHAPRTTTTLVMQVETGDGGKVERVGITRDASKEGFLIGSASCFEKGQKLTLVLQRHESDPPKRVRCEVVRSVPNPSPASAFWLYLVAVHFLEEVPGIDELIAEAVRHQTTIES
jgi:hypothetical protein